MLARWALQAQLVLPDPWGHRGLLVRKGQRVLRVRLAHQVLQAQLEQWDLKGPLRRGASDADLEGLLRWAVQHKELKHRINEPGFVRASRSMSQIGG